MTGPKRIILLSSFCGSVWKSSDIYCDSWLSGDTQQSKVKYVSWERNVVSCWTWHAKTYNCWASGRVQSLFADKFDLPKSAAIHSNQKMCNRLTKTITIRIWKLRMFRIRGFCGPYRCNFFLCHSFGWKPNCWSDSCTCCTNHEGPLPPFHAADELSSMPLTPFNTESQYIRCEVIFADGCQSWRKYSLHNW